MRYPEGEASFKLAIGASGARLAHRTMAQIAFSELQEAIIVGELASGTPLRLEELGRSLGMSVSPVREAVRQLDGLGLVEYAPHRGARVSELTIEDLRDTYEVRIALETRAVRRAARRFGQEHEGAVRQALMTYGEALRRGDEREARGAHTQFHFALYEASGSAWLVRMIRPPWENSERYRVLSSTDRGGVDERRREHDEILSACVRREPEEATAFLQRHLALTANLVARKRLGAGDLFDESGRMVLGTDSAAGPRSRGVRAREAAPAEQGG